MNEYLPAAYVGFRSAHPDVAERLDALAAAADQAGGLNERDLRLVKLGIAIGRESEGAVRSNVRKARSAGIADEDIRHAALLAVTTAGFPTAIASLQWIEEVLGPATVADE
jgi:alkylhydroperoxidase/carboxymuconolactone decarboxylase family protein YurZ